MLPEPATPLVLPSTRFAGREAFTQLVRDALTAAAQQNWREIFFCDATFEDWPLQEKAVADALHAWSKSGRRFVMLAGRYDLVLRHHARFVSWRKTWDPIVESRIGRNLGRADFPSAIWSPAWALQRFDLMRSTGVCGAEPDRRAHIREMLDELMLGSSPGFPASTLGL